MTLDTHTFKTFPEFSRLTLAEREAFEKIVRQYPPVGDLSFPDLINWWDAFDSLTVSSLNNNLVISYWMPGLEKYSGLALVGTNKVDQSICAIFDYQKEKGERPRLVNVPEFVISNVQYPELFIFREQRALNEYIISLEKFYPLDHMVGYRRRAVRRFIAIVGEENISLRSIDLSTSSSRQLLLGKVDQWKGVGVINTTFALEQDAIRSAIAQAESIGMENVCLFVNGDLQAFCLYYPMDERYVVISHVRIGNTIPHIFNYVVYALSGWLIDQGLTLANLHSDLGYLEKRMIKLVLGPVDFVRKYSIEPKGLRE